MRSFVAARAQDPLKLSVSANSSQSSAVSLPLHACSNSDPQANAG
jgi:hypothetical protein